MKKVLALLVSLMLIILSLDGSCQNTVLSLFKTEGEMADAHYQARDFQGALKLYSSLSKRAPHNQDYQLRIARCYFNLKLYQKSLLAYERCLQINSGLPADDLFLCAEANAAMGNYSAAVECYRQYLERFPDDEVALKKIWRLNNIRFVYEDSLHHAVRPISVNSSYSDFCAVPCNGGVVFVSNRKSVSAVNKLDASLNAPFYRYYFAKSTKDTSKLSDALFYGDPIFFGKELNTGFHSGAFDFYHQSTRVVFASTGKEASAGGERNVQLYFADELQGRWTISTPFAYNNVEYSLTDPTISDDGKELYFSSDMPGGFGGKDLYRSEFLNGKWTTPVNLGSQINTRHDEVFPYLHNANILYFSSNGHPGIGGLDIFKVRLSEGGFEEVQHLGYPINTNFDEFGIFLDSTNTHGYFSSNRSGAGYNDDIFEFDIDLQTYPLVINGVVRFKEHSWNDSSELKIFSDAKLYVIDNLRNINVHESTADAAGNFSIVIPYFSQFRIRVVGPANDEHVVSLVIPKHRNEQSEHEIVIVKDVLKDYESQVIK